MSDNHTHEHTHTHADGTTHAHTHTHADGTTHSHSHAIVSSPEEAKAMLGYMLSHNQHHAEELHELAHCFEAEIADLVHDAVDRLEESNDLMDQALALLNNAQD